MKLEFFILSALMAPFTAAQHDDDDAEHSLTTKSDDSRFDGMKLAPGKLKYEDPEGDGDQYLLASSDESGAFTFGFGSTLEIDSSETLYGSIGDKGFLTFSASYFSSQNGFKCSPDKTFTLEGQQNWFLCTGNGSTIYEKPAVAFSENAELQKECHRIQIECTSSVTDH